MAEEPKINLNNWSLWISPDEYIGWSYFYAEWIDSQSSSKWFRLGNLVQEYNINKRANWITNRIEYFSWQPLFFTNDWYLEYSYTYVGSPSEYFSPWSWGWALYRRSDNSIWYLNWIKLWNKIYWITRDKIDVITLGGSWTLDMFWTSLINNPWLTSDTWWTVWAWWTTWANWATHTSWTNTLKQQIATVNWAKYRIAIKFTKTAWTLTVRLWSWTAYAIANQSDDWWIVTALTAWWDNLEVIFTPSTDFAWTISYVDVNEYTATIEENKITITNTDAHPLLYSQWYLFIWSWSSIDFIEPTLLVKEKTLNIIDSTYTIVALTQVGANILIWATDWNNSKQYYWDWISSFPNEVVHWKWLKITAVDCDWIINYVVTDWNWVWQQVFSVDWYIKTPLAEYVYDWRNTWNNWDVYHPSKKFNFYTYNANCISIYDETLYVPCKWWIYNYWSKVTWLNKSWNKSLLFSDDFSDYITAIEVINQNPTFTYEKWWINKYWIWLDYLCTSSWYLVTNPIYRDDIWTDKDKLKIRIWYKNIDSSLWDIKIYAIVDDFIYWTSTVSNITVAPAVWDKYSFWTYAYLEIMSTDLTLDSWKYIGTIVFKMYDSVILSRYQITPTWTFTKITWSWDSSISYTSVINWILVKTITNTQIAYWNEVIFSKHFLDISIPKRHKLQLMIELTSSAWQQNVSPEIYDIWILATPINQNA